MRTGNCRTRLAAGLIVVLAMLPACAMGRDSETTIRFAMPSLPPYAIVTHHGFDGSGVLLIRKMAATAGLNLKLKPAPNYGRAWREMRKGRADGVAFETRPAALSPDAFFVPLPVNSQRCWFVRRTAHLAPQSTTFRRQASVAVFLNSGAYQWLLRHRYQQVSASARIDALPLMLLRYHRVRAVLAARAIFNYAASAEGLDSAGYRCIPQSSHRLGVYISDRFREHHPDAFRQLRQNLLGYLHDGGHNDNRTGIPGQAGAVPWRAD